MSSVFPVLVLLCIFIYLLSRMLLPRSHVDLTPDQRQYRFIVDVCDGREKQAQRLIEEKRQSHPGRTEQELLYLVYVDMLALTAEERAAACIAPASATTVAAVRSRDMR